MTSAGEGGSSGLLISDADIIFGWPLICFLFLRISLNFVFYHCGFTLDWIVDVNFGFFLPFFLQTSRPASMKKDGIQTRNRKLSAKTKKGLNRTLSGMAAMSPQDLMKSNFNDKNSQFRFAAVPGLTHPTHQHGMMSYPSNMSSYSHYSLHTLAAHTGYGQLQGGMDHFGGGSSAMLQNQQSGYSTFPNGQGNYRDISRALRWNISTFLRKNPIFISNFLLLYLIQSFYIFKKIPFHFRFFIPKNPFLKKHFSFFNNFFHFVFIFFIFSPLFF